MSESKNPSSFDGFYIKANLSEDGRDVEIMANEIGLRYLNYIIAKLIESDVDGKHFHLDKIAGLEGNIRSVVITRTSPPF